MQILTPEERKVLYELSKHSNMIISNTDKSGAVVIQDVKYYIKETKQQFGNKEYYKMLDSDPTETHKKLVNPTID